MRGTSLGSWMSAVYFSLVQVSPQENPVYTYSLFAEQPKKKRQEKGPTFIAVTDGVKVDVVLVVADEEEAKPGVKGVNGHDKEDADDVTLLVWHRV